ncbi:hypothetical protein [Pseudomonas lurida]|uniref:hypothetical protein n=1 Tax=Pseudomonas lurida TaxID=244566 RepID=UPI0016480D80|nr:hypothetical protein [Pseudomonas lurida]MBC3234017.1 hypothetical protein [Pseudomonas lurida]
MSVQPGPTFKRYDATGVATVYTIPFLLLDAADLQITLNGTLVTTGFSLTGIGNPTSSCTFTAPPTGDLLFLMVVPFQRLADYQINGDFLAQTVNRDYDRLWLAIKQLSRDNTRGLTVSLLEPEGIPTLPVKAARALKVLAFDANGDPVTSTLTLAQLEQQPALALDAAAQAAASATASAGSATASGSSATASAASAVLAQKWAENAEDVPVTTGLFSAHHWANKAAALVASISSLYTRMTAVELRATNLEFGYASSNQTWTAGGTITLSHGLGVVPTKVELEAECVTASEGYAVGAIIHMGASSPVLNASVSLGCSIIKSSTQIIIRIASSGLIVVNNSTLAVVNMTPANWRIRVKCSAT